MQVIVVEKGRYIRTAELSLLERDAFQQMYEGCGLATTDDTGEHLHIMYQQLWLLSLALKVLALSGYCGGRHGCNVLTFWRDVKRWHQSHSLNVLSLKNSAADAGINILAGATLGGGTRINWYGQSSFRQIVRNSLQCKYHGYSVCPGT